jgi:hypothetical protein
VLTCQTPFAVELVIEVESVVERSEATPPTTL